MKKEAMNNDKCQGCNDHEAGWCSYRPDNKDGSCPCVVCIIKAMCSHNPCDNWINWSHNKEVEDGRRS